MLRFCIEAGSVSHSSLIQQTKTRTCNHSWQPARLIGLHGVLASKVESVRQDPGRQPTIYLQTSCWRSKVKSVRSDPERQSTIYLQTSCLFIGGCGQLMMAHLPGFRAEVMHGRQDLSVIDSPSGAIGWLTSGSALACSPPQRQPGALGGVGQRSRVHPLCQCHGAALC